MKRRAFLWPGLVAGAAALRGAGEGKRLAAVVTEYRENSHADVIVGKYLQGYRQDGRPPRPRSRVVSLYTAQVPANDLSRARAKQYNLPIFPRIGDALTFGTGRLAVDGVLLIGEHGDYPTNEKGQKLYPRFEFFTEITAVFRKSGRAVPVFNDKHLSYSFAKAKRMVEISRELKFPMMAGSSVPVAYRKPLEDTPYGANVRRAVAIGYSGIEIYGFHLLEALQCMVERRNQGETGVRRVQCLENGAVWEYLGKTGWARDLLDQAIAHSETRKPGALRELVKEPVVFLIEYRDGLQAAAFLLTGAVEDFTVAVDIEGQAPLSLLMKLEEHKPYGHFGCLIENIEQMFETGAPAYPVERTLLTSGILDFLLESRFRKSISLETPDLGVRYQPGAASHFCRKPYGAVV